MMCLYQLMVSRINEAIEIRRRAKSTINVDEVTFVLSHTWWQDMNNLNNLLLVKKVNILAFS